MTLAKLLRRFLRGRFAKVLIEEQSVHPTLAQLADPGSRGFRLGLGGGGP